MLHPWVYDLPTSDVLERLAGHPRLALAIDLDGTLIPVASKPGDAVLDGVALELVRSLAERPNTWVALVTGRPSGDVEGIPPHPSLWILAEHGVAQRIGDVWTELRLTGEPPDEIHHAMRCLAESVGGALLERKRWSSRLHYHGVRPAERDALIVEASALAEAWIAAHPEYELLEGHMALEVRHREAHKGRAIEWLRDHLPAETLVLALGDDATDEDAFAALGPDDVAISVGPTNRPSKARANIDGVSDVRAMLGWLASERGARRPRTQPPVQLRIARSATAGMPLVVVSNRLPVETMRGDSRVSEVGGLVSGLSSALDAHRGIWLGWSGQQHEAPDVLSIDVDHSRASFKLAPDEHARYYNGLSNRALWPTFHGFIERTRFREDEWATYVEVNRRIAEHVLHLVAPDGHVWVHDFHVLLVARTLRARGFTGRLGHFLHIPFPPPEALETLPCARELVESMLAFDLLGFHTVRYADNFRRAAQLFAAASLSEDERVVHAGGRTRVAVLPLGVDAAAFDPAHADGEEIAALRRGLDGRKLLLGVDRLDYTKGIVERIAAFARLFELHPEWRGRVTLLQICVPSRSEVPEYVAQRKAVEEAVGRVNGEHGESHWVPIRYVFRSYDRATLAGIYRAADVALVTPLRDGMNLVAKEFVAAQDPERPGVLVLSRFAGAAEELTDAILTNPYHRGGMARDIASALSMPLWERVSRHQRLRAVVRSQTPDRWARTFLDLLASR